MHITHFIFDLSVTLIEYPKWISCYRVAVLDIRFTCKGIHLNWEYFTSRSVFPWVHEIEHVIILDLEEIVIARSIDKFDQIRNFIEHQV